MPPGTRTRYAKCGEVDIAYQVLGDGPVDLLVYTGALIPIDCVDEEPAMARFQRRLGSFSRLIRFDRRGMGLSDRGSASAPPTREQWVQDALAVLDAVGSKQAAVFAPFSNSPEGVTMAAACSERVSHLIVVNGLARFAWAPDYPVGVAQSQIDSLVPLMAKADAVEHGHDAVANLAPSLAEDPAFRAWWDRSGNRAAAPEMARAILEQSLQVDVRHCLAQVRVPTLVLHRSDIEGLGAGHGRYLAEHIVGAKYVELPGSDTLYWVGDTERMLDEIEEFLTGVRGGPGAERVLATVLFTDIVGSTHRAALLGDRRWRDLLERHDRSVRQQLERFRGREVDKAGDGFLARFDSPGRAIECALAIRDALGALDLDVRAGIHTGEIELRGDDVTGLAVHIGARVSALAGAGEVFVSAAVPPLVAGSDITFADRGEYTMKGVPGAWRIFAVES
jgi:class 3 adenylate cyclase